jgi:hypothetical protein
MQFHCGAVPEDGQFQPETEGWSDIREPSPIAVQVIALPVAIGLLGFLGGLLFLALPQGVFSIITVAVAVTKINVWGIVIICALLIPAHELVHALCHPRFGLSQNTIVGVWPTRLVFYAHYEGPMSRNHFAWVFVGPFVVLSLVPIGIIALLRAVPLSPNVVACLVILSLINGAASAGDLIGLLLILFQIPGSATVRNRGWKTFWKSTAEA